MLFLIRLGWEANEAQLSPPELIRAALTTFTSHGLETRIGVARSTARFDSESLFGLTQSSFLSSRHGPRLDLAYSSARFARSPARRIAVGSARHAIRDSAHPRSWLGLGLGLDWVLGDYLNYGLGSALSSARGSARGSARDWLGNQDTVWLDSGLTCLLLTCLGLVLGTGSRLGSALKPGPARGSTNIHLCPQCHFKSFTHACSELVLFSPNIFHFPKTIF